MGTYKKDKVEMDANMLLRRVSAQFSNGSINISCTEQMFSILQNLMLLERHVDTINMMQACTRDPQSSG